MKEIKINSFAKGLVLKDNKHIKSFIRNFKGGQGDEENFNALMLKIDSNRLGIPMFMQEKIDWFISEYLEPMVFEADTVFAESNSAGNMIDGVQHIDTEEELLHMAAGFYEVLMDTEDAWDAFAMEELHPYLIH